MKVPDKIYVPMVDLGIEDGVQLHPVWWRNDRTAENKCVVGVIPYIRKEALLEWARKEADGYFESFARELCGMEGRMMGEAFEKLIKEINSL